MADKLLISISARLVSVAHWHGRGVVACEAFPHTEQGLDAFRDHLAGRTRLPIYLIVDAVEEDYRIELLPHTWGSDRSELVQRKLNQHYRNTPYRTAIQQGRDQGKRRDDRYLFCALTNPDLIDGWLAVAIDLKFPIAGIYLLPTLNQGLMQRLQIKQANLLVVSADSSGLRLTFLRDQRLRVSRLARIDNSGSQVIDSYAAEISNTRLYLHALRVMPLDEQLSVLIIDRDDKLTELQEAISRDNPNIDCRRLGRQEIVERVGISKVPLEAGGDVFYLHLLGLGPHGPNLAPSDITLRFRQRQTRRGVYALASLSAFAAAAWCLFTWYQIYGLKSDTAVAAQQTQQLQTAYQIAAKQFPAAPTTAENLKRAVELSHRIGAMTRSPETMMNIVSAALEVNPGIFLRTFGWKYGSSEISADASVTLRSPGDSGPAASAGGGRKQSALITGEVRPFRGDYRAAIDGINRFADTLSKRPEVAEVKVLAMPLNISPGLTLSGNTTDAPDQSGRAEFRLLVALKPPL